MKKLLIVLALLITVSANAQWVKVLNGLSYNSPVWSLATSGNYVYAGSDFGVYFTTNDGLNWTRTNLDNGKKGFTILIDGTNILAGTQFGVYKTTNNGTNWTQSGLTTGIFTMAKNGDTIFAGSQALGVYRSTNNGTNWTQTSLNNKIISSLAIKGNMIFAGDNAQAIVYRSTDNGNNWTQFSLGGGPTRVVLSLAVKDNNIFAGTDNDGIFISTNNGLNWTQTSFNNTSVLSFLVNGNNIFAGVAGGVYLSTNQGVSWINKSQGMGLQWIWSLTANSQYIFVGNDSCAWRRSLTEIVGVQNISTEIPEKYSLSQNYPNPFNPGTNIEFTLPKTSFIKITVFDIAGKEVETLVNERLQSGTYKANWNASAYTSGVYFYKLITDGYSETKRMLLVK